MHGKLKCVILLILLTCLWSVSCEPLKTEPESLPVSGSDAEEHLKMVNGIYYLISEVHNQDYFYLLSRSDDVNVFSYLSDRCELGNCNLESILGNFFQDIYRAIISANKLLDELDPVSDKALYGEVLFLKGYCYFKLSRLFNDPPYMIIMKWIIR